MNTGSVVLFVVLGICLLTELPVAFSIGINCMALLIANGYPPLDIVVRRMVSGAKSFSVMVMPMSISAGSSMVHGSTPHLMKFANIMLWKIPGGLGAMTLAACGLLGAVSGSGVANVVAIGKIISPEMLEQECPRGLTVGLIAAGGIMACTIPPSTAMVVHASSSKASMGDMPLASFVSGFICIIALTGLNTLSVVKRGSKENVEKTGYTAKERLKITGDALLPLLMPIFVLGGVFSGICTATEASVVAVIYPLILAVFVYRELTLREFYKVTAESVATTGVIVLIISVATPFGWIMSIQNVPILLANWLLSITSSKFLIAAFMFLFLLLLGTSMETMCIIILVTPTLLPIIQTLGTGAVHHGVSMLMVLTIGSLTPSPSVNLFTACRVLNVKYDEAFLDTLRVILTVTARALPIFAVSEITELLPAVLRQGGSYGYG